MSHEESVASSAVRKSEMLLFKTCNLLSQSANEFICFLLLIIKVRAAVKVKASVIIAFTTTGTAPR